MFSTRLIKLIGVPGSKATEGYKILTLSICSNVGWTVANGLGIEQERTDIFHIGKEEALGIPKSY
jgi:hypothetical protein